MAYGTSAPPEPPRWAPPTATSPAAPVPSAGRVPRPARPRPARTCRDPPAAGPSRPPRRPCRSTRRPAPRPGGVPHPRPRPSRGAVRRVGTRQIPLTCQRPRHLAARRPWHRARWDEQDVGEAHPMPSGHGRTHGPYQSRYVDLGQARGPRVLGHHDPPLTGAARAPERGEPVTPDRRMGVLDGGLQVLRIVIAAVDDDQVLQPTGDDQLPLQDRSQVTGAQPAVGCEDTPGLLFLVPVAAAHVGTPHLDLTDLALGQRGAGDGIDDTDLLPRRSAAARQQHGPGVVGPGGQRLPLGERVPVQGETPQRFPGPGGADEDGRLGEPVRGTVRLRDEALTGEGGLESVGRAGADRLTAVYQRDDPVEP